ncbi:MAG: hypothetical protein AB1716_04580 [Planctomycetota bacterium]
MFRLISGSFAILALLAAAGSAAAQDFALDWWTFDGGGAMWTTGGSFELSGTVGQPDASLAVMAGGSLELRGGFWPGIPAFRVGDLNCDGQVNFADINPFVLALSDPAGYAAAYPHCNILNGDCNADGHVDFDDINPFVALLTR